MEGYDSRKYSREAIMSGMHAKLNGNEMIGKGMPKSRAPFFFISDTDNTTENLHSQKLETYL